MIRLTFRPLRRPDLDRLAGWLAQAHVQRWWHHDPLAVDEDFGPSIDGQDRTELFVIELDGRPIGMIQRYRIDDNPDWRDALAVIDVPAGALGIDYLIGEAGLINRGIGTELIRTFVDTAWRDDPTAPAIIVDVDPENRPSWRVLERAGFERVWSGWLEQPDDEETGPCHLYRLDRPGWYVPRDADQGG